MPSATTSTRLGPSGQAWQPDDLIRTKLYIPQARPNLVARPALLARLNEGLSRKLTLLLAPAGFGKTTLLSAWIAARSVPAAWVSLDARDNDPLRFAAYVVAALETLELGLGRGLLAALRGELAAGEGPTLEGVLIRLINDITEVTEDFVLVLDDYHVLTAPALHEAVLFLLDHLPPQAHLVLTSRTEPPLALSRWRARGQLVELRAADLRFSQAEAAAFLNHTMGLALAPAEIAALDSRSEGWVASLQLAALSLRDHPHVADIIQAFNGSHRYVVDYLAEQVLLQQPEAIQTFLLETSILERLSAPLCDYILKDEGGRRKDEANGFSLHPLAPRSTAGSSFILQELDRANLFVTALDDQRQWYRYHPLFTEFLQERLRQTRLERMAGLHRRAAEWYVSHSLMEDAVQHALAAQDYALATNLIEQVAETLWGRSQILTMQRWMQAMPPALVRAQPRLCVQQAWALAIGGQLDEVEPYLQAAEASLPPGSDQPAPQPPPSEEAWHATPQRLVVQIALIRAFVARFRGDLDRTVAQSDRALALTPAICTRATAVALIMRGHARLLQNDLAAGDRDLAEARAKSLAARHMAAYLSATNYIATLRIVQGRLHQAAALYREAQQFTSEAESASLSGIDCIGLGSILREQHDLAAAEAHIERGLRMAEAGGDFTFMRDGYVARARLEQVRGQWEAALATIHQAELLARRSQHNLDLRLISAWRARLCLARGDVGAAVEWAQASGLRADDPAEFLREYEHLTLARVLLAQGRLAEAEALLGRLIPAAEAAGRAGRVLEAWVVLALVQQAQGQAAVALATLDRALALAEPEHYVRLFLDEGEPMLALLIGAREHGPVERQAYIARLLSFARASAPASTLASTEAPPGDTFSLAGSAAPTTPALIEPLSEREQTVLRLLAAGLSNQDIAQELVVAQSTVHWHVKNIYSKLNVHNRTQATLMARELGLIG